jgi:hypothetical protein
MASFLDSQLKGIVAQAFKGQLSDGTLRKETYTTRDPSTGDPSGSTVTTYPFNGIRDSFNAAFAAQAGIPTTDVRVLVLLGSLPEGILPSKDDKVFILGAWFQVRKVLEIDPANAAMTLQVFQVQAP